MANREIYISGNKGGAGSTTVTLLLVIWLYKKGRQTFVGDLNICSPELQFLLKPVKTDSEPFIIGQLAVIDSQDCLHCNICEEKCRFGAISNHGFNYFVDNNKCTACSLCKVCCPVEVIEMKDIVSGNLVKAETIAGTMYYMNIRPGAYLTNEIEHRLISKFRQSAKELELGTLIIDCPPEAYNIEPMNNDFQTESIYIIEPDVWAIDYLKTQLTKKAPNVMFSVILNKKDINPDISGSIEEWLTVNDINYYGSLEFLDEFRTMSIYRNKSIDDSIMLNSDVVTIFEKIFPELK